MESSFLNETVVPLLTVMVLGLTPELVIVTVEADDVEVLNVPVVEVLTLIFVLTVAFVFPTVTVVLAAHPAPNTVSPSPMIRRVVRIGVILIVVRDLPENHSSPAG